MENLDVFGDTSFACNALAIQDKALAAALVKIESPVIRRRDAGFAGLFRIVVEQQVSVASAQAIWGRCERGIRPLTAENVISLGIDNLRSFGLSKPKANYVTAVANAEQDGSLDFSIIPDMDDATAAKYLCKVKGIGPWSAGIYLLFCEGRPDIWPSGDVALLAAYAAASGFSHNPAMKDFDAGADAFKPYRGIAAHILWTYYAHLKGRKPI